ncbi:MAG: transporter, partial [Armatimonadetes bacterium]|nr:transporter [Armatimonadota bacterium]
IRQEDRRFLLRFDPERVSPAALIARITARYPVRDLFVQNPPIEEIIARLYAGARV